MKNLTNATALGLILAWNSLVHAQLPPALVSEVNPLDTKDFAAAFHYIALRGNVLHLQAAPKDSGFQIQIGTGPITPLSIAGADLPIGTETHIFDKKIFVKFMPFPSSERDKYLFLVEASNAQGLTRVGQISIQPLSREQVPIAGEQPVMIDCVHCLHRLEDQVANGSYRYVAHD